jgi:uncharacterized protein
MRGRDNRDAHDGERTGASAQSTPQPYMNPSVAGIVLGVVLLSAFVVAGRGLGASGAFADFVAAALDRITPSFVTARPALADRLPSGVRLADEWIVWQIVGLVIGAALSAKLAGRWGKPISGGIAQRPSRARIARAVAGGVLMGIGARLAYGCTSGLALSGGAMLATGAWVFIPIAFATAIGVTLLVRSSAKAAW